MEHSVPRARHGVEVPLRKGQPVGRIARNALDRKRGRRKPGAHATLEHGRRVQTGDAAHALGVALEVEPGAEANLQHLPACARQDPSPESAVRVASEAALHEAREDVFRVYSHTPMPDPMPDPMPGPVSNPVTPRGLETSTER